MSLRLAQRVADLERTLIRRLFDSAPPDAINLGLGQPDLPTPPQAALAGIAAIARGRTGYTPTGGDPDLRAAVARRYLPFAMGAESVVITVGSQEAMFVSCLALLDPGDELLYPDPGYPAYPVVARLVGARPVPYLLRDEDRFEVCWERIEPALSDRTRLVILCAPSNPTGACHRREELTRIVLQLERRGIGWLSDEVYAGFSYDEPLVSPAELSREGIVVGGLSKDASMTGWRVGWAVGAPSVIERILAAHQYLVTCAPGPSQAAALGALSEKGLAEQLRMLDRFRSRHQLMGAELARIEGVRFHRPSGAFYYFVDVSRFGESLAISRRVLERRKVITIPGEAFGTQGRGYLRLSYAASEKSIVDGVRALGAELDEIGREAIR